MMRGRVADWPWAAGAACGQSPHLPTGPNGATLQLAAARPHGRGSARVTRGASTE